MKNRFSPVWNPDPKLKVAKIFAHILPHPLHRYLGDHSPPDRTHRNRSNPIIGLEKGRKRSRCNKLRQTPRAPPSQKKG
ncbi:hypothetical protein Hanom_Chr16g01519321 [Helianthus anomalus]